MVSKIKCWLVGHQWYPVGHDRWPAGQATRKESCVTCLRCGKEAWVRVPRRGRGERAEWLK